MFRLIPIICILFSTLASSKDEVGDVYTAYKDNAYRNAIRLAQQYYGNDVLVQGFTEAPGGLFSFSLLNTADNSVVSMYLLNDLNHLIQGRLVSPFTLDTESNIGDGTIKLVAQNNVVKQRAIEQVTSTVMGDFNTPKTVDVLDGEFADLTQTAFQGVLVNENRSGLSEKINLLMEKAKNSEYIEVGTSPRVVYMFLDPMCSACIKVHQLMDEYTRAKQLTVRYIPVAFLGDESEKKATYMLIPNANQGREESLSLLMAPLPFDQLISQSAPLDAESRGDRRMSANTLLFYQLPKPMTSTFILETVSGPQVIVASSSETIKRIVSLATEKYGS